MSGRVSEQTFNGTYASSFKHCFGHCSGLRPRYWAAPLPTLRDCGTVVQNKRLLVRPLVSETLQPEAVNREFACTGSAQPPTIKHRCTLPATNQRRPIGSLHTKDHTVGPKLQWDGRNVGKPTINEHRCAHVFDASLEMRVLPLLQYV